MIKVGDEVDDESHVAITALKALFPGDEFVVFRVTPTPEGNTMVVACGSVDLMSSIAIADLGVAGMRSSCN